MLAAERRQAAVEAETHVEIGDVIVGDQDRDAEVDLRRPLAFVFGAVHLARAHFCEGFFEHVLIQLVTDFFDVAGLFFAEQVARAANVHVMRGEVKARAQRVEAGQNFQALFGLRGQRLTRLGREVGIGAGLGASYPPANLVKLCEAEVIRAVNDQRVGRRNVEAGFHDGCRQQNVELTVVELVHHIIERAGGHLAMRRGEFELGQLLTQELFDLWQVSNARGDIEGLPAAIVLAQ